MIKSTRHHLKDWNIEKKKQYLDFLDEYSMFCIKVIDSIWSNGYDDFSIKKEKLNLPKYIDYKKFKHFSKKLSCRAMSSAVTQVSQIIRSCIEKQRRVVWVKENKNVKIKDKKFSKPIFKKINPILSSKCCDFQFTNTGKFLGFLNLKSIGESFGEIKIPINNQPLCEGEIKNGFLLNEKNIQVSWEKEINPIEKGEKTLAIDQGIVDVVTCSDEQKIPQIDTHGHSMKSIMEKMTRKKKGSKAFKRAQNHRKNFTNWTINQINFNGVKEVRLEKIVNIRFRKKTSRKMSHWSNPEIMDKIKSRCLELEVPVVEQSCSYRSQRCNQCGQVRKANRKGKQYNCKHCGYSSDADLNASLNHVIDLPDVPKAFLGSKLNLKNGFFWNPDGFFNYDGSELRVPNNQN
jgi:predicted RNA-binding Zn-ribbon protein involved in translation (DUF1610 family)